MSFRRKIALVISAIIISVWFCGVNAAGFSDTKGHWAEDVIEKWSRSGVVVGYDGCFNPDSFITRGDMAIILCRVQGYDTLSINTFKDLSMTDYFVNEVLKLNREGVLLGSDGYVRPFDSITREEAFVMLNRIYKYEGTSTPEFQDVNEISDWAKDAVFALCENKIVNGSDGRINPQANITRAEVVQLLENISKPHVKLENSEPIGGDDIWAGEIK